MQHVCLVHLCFFLSSPGAHLALHVLTPSFPTRRSSDLQQRQPVGFGEPDLAQHDRRYRRNVVGIERDERREPAVARSEEHTSELQSLMRNSYDVLCWEKKKKTTNEDRYGNNKQYVL